MDSPISSWCNFLEKNWAEIQIPERTALARVDDGGLRGDARVEVLDVNLSATERIVVWVGWIVHRLRR